MATKDIIQTNREYKERCKRLNIEQSFTNKEKSKLNEIEDIDKKIEQLQAEKEEKIREHNDISSEKLRELSALYNDPDLLSDIVEKAKQTTFSRSILENIILLCETGINSDDITLEQIKEIVYAEKIINKEIRHTNFICDLLNDFGDSVKLPGEEVE